MVWKADDPLTLRGTDNDDLILNTPIGQISWKVIRRGLGYVHREQVRREELYVIRKASALKAVETKRRNKLIKQGEVNE